MNENLVVTVITKHAFTEQDLDHLLVAAFEGGINYWANNVKIKVYPETTKKIDFASQAVAHGGVVEISEDEGNQWTLTRELLIKGIAKYCNNEKVNPAELMDMHDADTADAIVQYAIFEEIIYG